MLLLAWCYANKICIGPDVTEPIRYQGVTLQMLLLCLLMVLIYLFNVIAILVTWPAPHPKYVAAGTCQYFC